MTTVTVYVDWSRKWLDDFNAGKAQLADWFCLISLNTGAIDVKMNWSVL